MQLIANLKEFIAKSTRVWQITRKPTKEEFKITSKASALGILLIGFIGFVISLIIMLLSSL